MSEGVKEITKLEKTSLSDFTLCKAELLPKLLKQLEERKSSVLPALHQFINCLCRLRRHVWKCERNEVSLRLQEGVEHPLMKETEKIRKSVYSILRQEQREQQPHRKQDMER